MTERGREAFRKIMGAVDMPDDAAPEYDEWLFQKSWDAAIQAGAAVARNDWYNSGPTIAANIEALKDAAAKGQEVDHE